MRLLKNERMQRNYADPIKYQKAFLRMVAKTQNMSVEDICDSGYKTQYVFLGVKAINELESIKGRTLVREDIENEFIVLEWVIDLIARMTPEQLMQMFPPERYYDGSKCSCKDYFTTMEAIQKMPLREEIGSHRAAIELLWEYHNWDIVDFMVAWMECLSRMRIIDGYMDPFEEFLYEHKVPTFTFHEKEGYMQNSLTGEITKISKPKKRIPKYFNTYK